MQCGSSELFDRMMKRGWVKQWMVACAVAAALWTPASVRAAEAAPQVIAHEGQLFDAEGAPLAGVVRVTFRLYAQRTGGAAVWSEKVDVEFDDGYFEVWLGEATPLDPSLLDGKRRWLAVSTADVPESRERVAVASTTHPMFASEEHEHAAPPAEEAPPPVAPAPVGPTRPAGVVVSAASADAEVGPLAQSRGPVFLGAIVGTVVEPAQLAIVSVSAALGSTAPGGAGELQLAICTRRKGDAQLVEDRGARRENLTVAGSSRQTFVLRSRLALAPGEYEVGLCGHATRGADRWNDNGASRVTVMITTR